MDDRITVRQKILGRRYSIVMFVYLGGVVGYRAGVMWGRGGGRDTVVVHTKAFRERKLRCYLLNESSLCGFISVYMHYWLKKECIRTGG